MSVDTYLKGKNLAPYQGVEYEDVKIYVANSLRGWAEEVHVDIKRFFIWTSFDVDAEHRHGAACSH